ncbi:MAG: DUF3667 domain-containing protein [Muribaculaceae bacterium]|nr:DUF3667 domain-containing protein [Muribaculaceae bacterium]
MNSDTIVLEGNNLEEIVESSEISEEKIKYCLNCGTEVNDKFCPHCGQSTSTPSKLKMKNFGKGVLMSFGRLTPGFLNTAKGLMFRPWVVIRDHIHGRHIPYSPPITMLIQIFLYATILFTAIDAFWGTDLYSEESLFGYEGENPLLKMIDQSVVFATFFVGVPMCFGVYLAYYRHGAKKYNFAEYLAAFVYLFAAINLWDTFLSLLNIVPGIGFDATILTFGILLFFSIVILLKAFPQKSKWKSVGLLLWCSFVLIFCIIILGLLMYLPHIIERLDIIKET